MTDDCLHPRYAELRSKPCNSVARLEDMSPDGILRLTRQRDGDIIVEIVEGTQDGSLDNEPGRRVHVEFCTYAGGGGSSRTLAALRNLMVAMAEDSLDTHTQARIPQGSDALETEFIAKWQRV